MISIVVAMGRNREIGANNKLLWHLPEDLKHFKKLTTGHPVIMGRKTFESIGKPLPNRTNIVVSSKTDWFQEGILIVGSIREAIKFAQKIDENVAIIGGGNIYEQTMDMTDILEVTRIDSDFDAEVFFPEIDENVWVKTREQHHPADERHSYSFTFETYERRTALKE